jgi:hypothetical protein
VDTAIRHGATARREVKEMQDFRNHGAKLTTKSNKIQCVARGLGANAGSATGAQTVAQ